MYESYWRLADQPFRDAVPPNALCLTSIHEEAQSRLQFAVEQQRQLAILSGPGGMGKTLLLKSLEAQYLRSGRHFAYVSATQLACDELIWEINGSLGLAPSRHAASHHLWRRLKDHIRGMEFSRAHVTVAIDGLDFDTCAGTAVTKLVQLAESPSFSLIYATRQLPSQLAGTAVNEFVDVHAALRPMSRTDTEYYVRQRLHRVSGPPDLFDPASLDALHRNARGYPRLINHLADLALLVAMDLERDHIDGEIIQMVCNELTHVA